MADLPPVDRPVPSESAVLWRPVGPLAEAPSPGAYPVFVARRALEALNKCADAPSTEGIIGFLIGDLCRCPESGVLYLFVDTLLGLSQSLKGDKTLDVTTTVWPSLQHQLVALKRHLLGWYHSHPPFGLVLTPGDLDAHLAYFPFPWQVTLVLSFGQRGPEGAFYRPHSQASSPGLPLPFYEVLDPRAQTRDGRRRSFVRWRNYQARRPEAGAAQGHGPRPRPVDRPVPGPVLPLAAPLAAPSPAAGASGAPAPAAPLTAPVIGLQASAAGAERERSLPAPLSPVYAEPRVARSQRRVPVKMVIGLAGAATLMLLAWGLSRPRASPRADSSKERFGAPPAVAHAAPASTAPLEAFSPSDAFAALGDSLAADLREYQKRATRFATGGTDCRDLGAAFATLEERWVAYSVRRPKQVSHAARVGAVADTTLFSNMDSVESSYERTGCARP